MAGDAGMQTREQHLKELVEGGSIAAETAEVGGVAPRGDDRRSGRRGARQAS
jgi:Tfp pilus assembly pilus retraction ATPase PilT